MAVGTTTTSKTFSGTGGAATYAPGFYVNSSDQVRVYVDDAIQTLGDDYVVGNVGAPAGCNIAATFPLGSAVFIERVTPLTQLVDTQNNETILEDVLDAEFDKLTMIAQEIDGKAERAVLFPKGETGFTFPSPVMRAGLVPQFDPEGDFQLVNPSTFGKGDPGSSVDSIGLLSQLIGMVIPAETAQISTSGYDATGLGAARYIADATANAALAAAHPRFCKQDQAGRYFRLLPEDGTVFIDKGGAKTDGSDAGPAFRAAILYANAIGAAVGIPAGTFTVNDDPASAFDDGGTTRYSWCIRIPSNTTLVSRSGGIIKGAAGRKNWSRVVVLLAGTVNVRCFGNLKIDGNVANIGVPNNEHMHGLLLFDATDCYFEALEVYDCRGDNIILAGTDNTRGTADIQIGRIKAQTAGRKNLVGQAFDNVYIGSAWLDNTAGGAVLFSGIADGTDGNCLDVEPDAINASCPKSRMYISYLFTRGAGNDITGGNTSALVDKLEITIGRWDAVIVPRATTPWHVQYGSVVNIGQWNVSGVTAVCPSAQIYYASRLNVERAVLAGASSGGANGLLEISQVANNVPKVRFGTLELANSGGVGLYASDADVSIGRFIPTTSAAALWSRGTSAVAGVNSKTVIDEIILEDVGAPTGSSYAVLISKAGNPIEFKVGHTYFRDSRAPKLNQIYYLGAGASAGVVLGSIDNPTTVAEINGDGPEKYYRTSGGGNTPAHIVTLGDPNGVIPAPQGSIALWKGGGAGTTFMVRETGAATNWTGK